MIYREIIMKGLKVESQLSQIITVLMMMLIVACGGGGDPGPTALSHHIDAMHLAQVPIAEQSAVVQAQADYNTAKMTRAKAQADYGDSGTKLDVAKNQRKQALLEEKSARSKESSANKSGDMNRINLAKREKHATELSRKAADYKVDTIKMDRKHLKKWLRYTEENVYSMEAKFELAKGQLAKDKNIKPRGFNFAVLQQQARDRSKRAQKAKVVADQAKKDADVKRKKWQALEKEAARMKAGNTSGDAADAGGTSP